MSKKLLLLGVFAIYKPSYSMQIATQTVTISRKMHKKVFNLAVTQEDFSLGNGLTTMAAFAAKLGAFTLFFFQIPLVHRLKPPVDPEEGAKSTRFTYDLIRLHETVLNTIGLESEKCNKNYYIFLICLYTGILGLPIMLFNYTAYKDLNGYLWNLGWYFLAMLFINITLYKNEFYLLNKDLKKEYITDDLKLNNATLSGIDFAHNPNKNKIRALIVLLQTNLAGLRGEGIAINKEMSNKSNRLHMFLMFNTPYVAALIIQMIRWNYVWKQVNQNISEKIIKVSDTLQTESVL